MTPVILVPVKEHAMAKSRMSPLLTAQERCAVAWAMLEDMIRALLPLSYPVAIITNSTRAAARVEKLGWRVLWEEVQTSESASVDAASKHLAKEGVEAVLRLPADLPLVRPEDVGEILSLPITAPGAVLAPSWDRTGTNALLRTPPDLFPSRFGPGSFTLHLREAAAAGAHLRIVQNPHLELDLDDPADIVRFLSRPVPGETYHTLVDLNIKERLANHAFQQDPDPGTAGDS
ncbi:MAG: 2-phospho-L-lactate guanylyltransferase [Acidobacteriia bacterium]|nr:2-phospho-L-lactate guanylyltransferase [Terriglobia bacterium]